MSERDEFSPVQKGFGRNRFNRLLRLIRKYRVLTERPGWAQTKDGIMPPPTLLEQDIIPKWWTLEYDTDNEYFTVTQGRIANGITDDDITASLSVTDNTSGITPADDKLVYLEVTGTLDSPAVALEYGTTWTDWPAQYTLNEVETDVYEWTHYRFPLWQFYSAQGDENTRKSLELGTVFGRHLCPFHLALYSTVLIPSSSGSATGAGLAVPILMPHPYGYLDAIS